MLESYPPNGANDPQIQEYNYQLLVGHERTDHTWKTDEQLRTEYVQLTDNLIYQMVSGVRVEDPVTHESSLAKPDVVVWLDKSARPLSWLTKDLWPILATDDEGNMPSLPQFRYVNIDREQWVNAVDPTGAGFTRVDQISPNIIRSLRSIFVEPRFKAQGITEKIDDTPSELDGKTVLLVDEVRSTGRTLEYAMSFFKRAFPNSRIAGTYWMGGQVMRDQAVGNADLPVWYREDVMYGRGVGNRDDKLAERSKSLTQQLGRYFLSNRLPQVDPLSERLRDELHQLSEDVRNRRLLIIPGLSRDIDEFEHRAVRLNGMHIDDFYQALQKLKKQ